MISLIVLFVCVFILAKALNKSQAAAAPAPVKAACPPHSWSYQPVYNEDGSVRQTRLVCAKCGPINGGGQ